jgi:hypothetical protein
MDFMKIVVGGRKGPLGICFLQLYQKSWSADLYPTNKKNVAEVVFFYAD